MIGVLDQALALIQTLQQAPDTDERDRLMAVARWAMEVQLAGDMPSLPAQNSALRAALMGNKAYLDRLTQVSELLGTWIVAGQQAGRLDARLPPEVLLYTIHARACHLVLDLLKASANYSNEQIIGTLLSTCFRGLAGPAPASAAPRPAYPAARGASARQTSSTSNGWWPAASPLRT